MDKKNVPNDWMEEAREIAAQCWGDKSTSSKVMDPELAEVVAMRIAAWMSTAAQNQRNTDYYRGLVERCGRAIGKRAFVADDGSICEDVLCAKVPEIIEKTMDPNAIRCDRTSCKCIDYIGFCKRDNVLMTEDGCMDYVHLDDVKEIEQINKEYENVPNDF